MNTITPPTTLSARVRAMREALEYYSRCQVAGKIKNTGGPGGHSYFEHDNGYLAKETLADETLIAEIEALESKPCPYAVTGKGGTSYCRLAEQNECPPESKTARVPNDTAAQPIDEIILDLEAVNYELGYEDAVGLPTEIKFDRREKLRHQLKTEVRRLIESAESKPVPDQSMGLSYWDLANGVCPSCKRWPVESKHVGADVVERVKQAIGKAFVPSGVWNIYEGWKLERAAKAVLAAMQELPTPAEGLPE